MKLAGRYCGRWGGGQTLVVFYGLAFVISWAGFAPELCRMGGSSWFRSPLWIGLLVLPAVGPAVAAWVASTLAGDGDGVGRVVKSLRRAVGWPWWMAAVGIPAGSFWVASWIGGLVPGGGTAVAAASPVRVAGALVISLAANVWEEVGWRGFALVRLQRRLHPLAAAAIVGALWALWHLPLLVIPESAMSLYPVGYWAIGTMSHSVVLAWLFNRTGRSLGVVTVAHVSWNVFGALFGVKSWGVLAGVEVPVALAVIWMSRGRLGYSGEAEMPTVVALQPKPVALPGSHQVGLRRDRG